jgi:cytochrome P450
MTAPTGLDADADPRPTVPPSPASYVRADRRSANPYTDAVAADPIPFYEALRRLTPVASMMEMPDTHVISRYEDVKFALQHPEIFSSDLAAVDIGQDRPLIPLQIDPPHHAKYRRMMDPQLSARHFVPLDEEVRRLVNLMIDGFSERGSCDFHAEFTVPLPCTVFLQLCGLPLDEMDTFLEWKDCIIRPQVHHPEAFDPEVASQIRRRTALAIYEYFADVVADRRANPGDDLFSRFAVGEIEGERMTDDQMLDMGFLFLLGGLDTVTSTLDCSVAHLGQDLVRRDELVADRSKIPAAVEELLRVHTPVMQVLRVVKEPYELHGVRLEPGDSVMVMIGAADTDPDEFGPTAENLDFDRPVNRHLAFGGGPHRCLGSHLARFELHVALDELHRRLPDYQVVDGAALTYSPGIREIASLPLEFTPQPPESPGSAS